MAATLGWELDNQRVIPAANLEEVKKLCANHPDSVAVLPLGYRFVEASAHSVSRDNDGASVVDYLPAHICDDRLVVYGDGKRLSDSTYRRAIEAGTTCIVDETSPTFEKELRDGVAKLLQEGKRNRDDCAELIERHAERGIVGQSAAMLEVFRRVARAAEVRTVPMIICGETGTGKQCIAEAIHAMDGRRSRGPCETVNCSAISMHLAESELFGHVRGAYTGAELDRLGAFRAAHGGTLILDEVADLHFVLQPKLLRVLEERRVSPVGSDCEYPVDVRVIAITNRPLEQLVAAGKFRRDLYERLNVFQINIPPLRTRPEDVELQATYFLHRHEDLYQDPVFGFSPRAMQALCSFPWPGNTRGLENAVRRTLLHGTRGALIDLAALPRRVVQAPAHQRSSKPEHAHPEERSSRTKFDGRTLSGMVEQCLENGLSWTESIQQFERQLLEAALERHGGNQTKTAEALGISRRALTKKLKNLKDG